MSDLDETRAAIDRTLGMILAENVKLRGLQEARSRRVRLIASGVRKLNQLIARALQEIRGDLDELEAGEEWKK